MRKLLTSLSCLLAFAACQKSDAAGKNPLDANAVGGKLNEAANKVNEGANAVAEVAKQTEAVKKVSETLGDLQKTLTSIHDGASANGAKTLLDGLVGKLTSAMGDLGKMGKLGDALKGASGAKDALVKAVSDQAAKLMANDQIKGAIGPVLDKLVGALKG